MAIAKLAPDTNINIINANPTIIPETYNVPIIDNSLIPLTSLVSYVSGAPWTVDYYSQVLGSDSDLKDQDIGQANIYQQYTKIRQMELRVTTAIDGPQNTDTAQLNVTGAALVYPFLTPNIGDMFIADVGDGHKGIFRVKSSERKSFNALSVYAIEYNLVAFDNIEKTRMLDLDQKVIRQYVFDKSRLLEGLNPTITNENYNNILSLNNSLDELIRYYFKTFYLKEFDTLCIPGQNIAAYDSFVVDYILKMVNTFDAYEIRFVRNYSTEEDQFLQQDQLWSILYRRDLEGLKYCNRTMGLVDTKYFNYNAILKGLRFSRLSHIVYPVNADFSLIDPNTISMTSSPLLFDYGILQNTTFTGNQIFKPQASTQVVEAKSSGGSISDLITNMYANTNSTIPIINPILNNSTYIFSPAFYEQTVGQTLLEGLTSDYLKGNSVDLNKLITCISKYKAWGRLEQFYYIPILITLIKYTMSGVY